MMVPACWIQILQNAKKEKSNEREKDRSHPEAHNYKP
jgi:hypothetical protein